MRFQRLALLVAVGHGVAQRTPGTPICDYYTTALLEENTAENQLALVTLIVNTVGIGNYTTPNVGIEVPGILAQGATFEGKPVNLLPYFNGMLASTNRGGGSGVSVNFLDGGGPAPIKENKAAEDTTSNQFFLLTHLYQFFGVLLGCSEYGTAGFPAYGGEKSQYEVHKFMALDSDELGYFNLQVALAAASFGVTDEDVAIIGKALKKLFTYRCSPPTTVVPEHGPQLQSMCTDEECPLDANATCPLYEKDGIGMEPLNATAAGNGTSGGGANSSSPSTSMSTPTEPPLATGAATELRLGPLMLALVAGLGLSVVYL